MNLLDIKNYNHLSEFLGIEQKKLGYMLFKLPRKELYTSFQIPKKSGSFREIAAPNFVLMNLQKKIKNELEVIYPQFSAAHGFIKKKSIVTNAKQHVGKEWVLNIDLQDFFSSITFQRVYGLLISKPFCFNKSIGGLISNLLTFNGFLPQGAPTSPVISNMICLRMDRTLTKYCKKKGIDYTRYADDMTFSSKYRDSLGKVYNEDDNILSSELIGIIEKNGFIINDSKIRCNLYFKHQEVTGIKTNEHLNIKKMHKYRIRSMLRAWEKYGIELATKDFMKSNNYSGDLEAFKQKYIDVLSGLISYSKMVLGGENEFFIKSAIRFNVLKESNHFKINYSVKLALDNSIFSITSSDFSQGVAFYADGRFFTCIHNILSDSNLEIFKNLESESSQLNFISVNLQKAYLNNYVHNDKSPILLEDASIIYFSIGHDLLVFSKPNYYSPYELNVCGDVPDIGKNYLLVAINHAAFDLDSRPCRLFGSKLIGDSTGHPMNIEVYQGMSGSPVLLEGTRNIYGHVVYGTNGTSGEDNVGKNGMFPFCNMATFSSKKLSGF